MTDKKNHKRLMVMAGGTGGHVFPALAVAQVLQQQGWEIRWLGTADRMEAHLVPNYGINIDFIEVKGLRGADFMRKLSSPLMVLKAVYQAKQHIVRWQPDVILGMGGYVSGPGGVAAYLTGIPIILHEQNAVAGLTNKLLAKIAKRVLQAFPSAFANKDVVGNPVRKDLCQLLPHPVYDDANPLKILIMGGSQGAQILNKIVPQAIALLKRDVAVFHQAGKGYQQETQELYKQHNIEHVDVKEFIDDIAQAYQWADIVICRSGALTVSEIAVAGLAAIFVPFMHKDRQQALNAMYLVENGAAILIEQPQLTAEKLAEELERLDASCLLSMAKAAKNVAIEDAAERVANVIIDVAR